MSLSGVASPPGPRMQLATPKQIRFVNNEGQPPPKRRRINAACRTCRKRKTRCDGKRPLCSTCTENGHDCMGYAEESESAVGGLKQERKDGKRDYNELDAEDNAIEEVHKRNPQTERTYAKGMGESRWQNSTGAAAPATLDNTARSRKDQRRRRSQYEDHRDSAVYSDDAPSPIAERSPSLHIDSHRVPYFRYFGPTAIVPGFKQMVVSVREHRRSTGAASAISMSPRSNSYGSAFTSSPVGGPETRAIVNMPIYDQNDRLAVHRLIIGLVETFFTHLGSNFPFLRQKSFLQRVEEKSAEPILVDAVCALAARFSDHPLLINTHDSSYPKSDYGHMFAQRAKAAVVDTFPCPTVAAVQACLLLAYESFGANQDSALWMYLGCAIRMAVDLGLHKLDGVRHQGQKDPGYHRSSNDSTNSDRFSTISAQEKQEVEQERIDTLWAVFMLDRVISSGTGRPVTLRDDQFELSFPAITTSSESGWPNPFPALIQIIYLYGRVSDLLNNIKIVQDAAKKKIDGLSNMEKDLTQLYQKLDHRLTFNATNFQHYVKSGDGTNFILVHFWFHTLIMLLHQPTLMHSLEGQILQLLPNSRELSMSSAKTIADILAFAELIDPRSFIGNPFTSQPMYIAACAFLMESAAHTTSNPTSRDVSQQPNDDRGDSKANLRLHEQKQKHSLLASAANQNYQRCYKALQQLETYWAGTRYILVALDQKAKGIWDPETYTEQEYEMTKVRNNIIPNWRGRVPLASPKPGGRFGALKSPNLDNIPGSPAIDPSQAIGWSLNGTSDSPSSNLTFMYQNMNGEQAPIPPTPPLPPAAGNMIYDPIRNSLPEVTSAPTSTSYQPARYSTSGSSTPNYSSHPLPLPLPSHQQQQHQQQQQQQRHMPPPPRYTTDTSTSDAEMLLGLQQHSPYNPHSHPHSQSHTHTHNNYEPSSHHTHPHHHQQQQQHNTPSYDAHTPSGGIGGGDFALAAGFVGDMMMESQEIDINALSGDMMPWLEYLPQDMLNFFGGGGGAGGGGHGDGEADR